MPGTASANGGIAELILSAGPVAKFVLLLLAAFSVICWALIVEKWWEFRKIRRDTTRFLRIFREARRFSVVYAAAKKHRESPLAQLYVAGGQELATAFGGAEAIDRVLDDAEEGIGADMLDALNRAMRRAAGERDRADGALPALPRHHGQRGAVHRPLRHGVGHHERRSRASARRARRISRWSRPASPRR